MSTLSGLGLYTGVLLPTGVIDSETLEEVESVGMTESFDVTPASASAVKPPSTVSPSIGEVSSISGTNVSVRTPPLSPSV